MRPDFSVRIIKELKGAPLSVLMALILAGDLPVNQDWLARSTGYTDKPVRQALAYLLEHGFVAQGAGGWMVSDRAGQLPLAAPLEIERGELAHGDAAGPDPDLNSPDRNNSDSPISILNKGSKDSDHSINTISGGRKNSDNGGGSSNNAGQLSYNAGQFSDFPEVGQALMDAGIRENVRTRRLLGRITPRDIRAMVAKIRDDPFHDLSETGLMVAILEGVAQRNERRGGYESWNSG